MAADEAGAAGNQEFHPLMFPPRREDAKSFFLPRRRRGVFVNVNVNVNAW
jgi:hypothetical protein